MNKLISKKNKRMQKNMKVETVKKEKLLNEKHNTHN